MGMERSHRFGCRLSFVGDCSLAFSDVPKRASYFFFDEVRLYQPTSSVTSAGELEY